MKTKLSLTVVAVAVLSIPGAVLVLYAQDFSASRKITGSVYRPHTASAYYGSAARHSETVNHYVQNYYENCPPETVQQHVAEVRKNMDSAKKEIDKLKADKSLKLDKEAQAQVDKLLKQHAKVAELCDMVDGECVKPTGDKGTICACCADIHKAVKAAEEEHNKLKAKLGVEKLNPAGNVAGKKAKEQKKEAAAKK